MEAHLAHDEDLTSAADAWPARPSAAPRRAHERMLVDSAIRLVTSGGAPSVTVVGVRGHDLLAHALSEGARAAVLVRARWWAEGDAFDLVVERDG